MRDPYLNKYGILTNKLGIDTDHKKLMQAEADICFLKLINIDSLKVICFDKNLIKQIHKHIFEDIYPWAGEFRVTPLFKEELVLPGYSIPYSDPEEIDNDLDKKLTELNSIAWQNMTTSEIAYTYARKIALIWKVHPFRDGNTRTMLSFSFLYAKEHGFPFDMKTFTDGLNRQYFENGAVSKYSIRDKIVLACLDEKDYPEIEHLANIFEEAINNYEEKSIKHK